MIEITLFFLMLLMVVLIFIILKKDTDQKQEINYLKRNLGKIENDLILAQQTQTQIKAENEEEQKILDMLRTMPQDEKRAKTASIEAFTQWLSSALPAIWNKIKGFIADVWRNIQNFFSG